MISFPMPIKIIQQMKNPAEEQQGLKQRFIPAVL
jgi:hypothetical protein